MLRYLLTYTEYFDFVPDLHMTISDFQRGDGLQPGKTLPWAKDHGLGFGWVQLNSVVEEPERQRRETLWESLHLRRNRGADLRVEFNIVPVLMKPDSVGLHDPWDGGYEGREEDRSEDASLRNARIAAPDIGPEILDGHVARSNPS